MAIKSSNKTRSPKKQTNTRPSQRKGTVVKTVPSEAKALLKKLHKENNGVKEMRKYPNGSIGVFFTNGKFRFVTGGTNLKPREKGSKVKYPRISKLAAKRALLKYYNNKSYKSPANRKSALTRDICSNNKPVNKTSLYRRSPHLYTYPGVDDGSQCPKGHKVYNKKKITGSVKKTLLNRLKSKTALRKKGTKKSPKLSPRRKSKVTKTKNQKGGVLNDNDISEIMEEYQNKLEGVDMQGGGELSEDEGELGMFVDHTMEVGHEMEGGDMESMDIDHEMESDHGMDMDHGMQDGDMESMEMDHEMEADHGMDMDHDMEGGDMESMEMDQEMEADHGMDMDHEMEADHGMDMDQEMEADHGMDMDQEMEADHGMDMDQEMEGGDLETMDMDQEMEADHGMDMDQEMEAGHDMEGGDLSHMGINSEDESHMSGDSNYSDPGANLEGVTGEMHHEGSELSMDSDDTSSSDEEEGQLGGGSDLSLNDAVGLLREYYTEKYGQ